MLIKARSKYKDTLFTQGLSELEQRIDELRRRVALNSLPALVEPKADEQPCQRLTLANDQLEGVIRTLDKASHVVT